MNRQSRYYFNRVLKFLQNGEYVLKFHRIFVESKYGKRVELAGLCSYIEGGVLIEVNPIMDILNTIIHECLHAIKPQNENREWTEARVHCLADDITLGLGDKDVAVILSVVSINKMGEYYEMPKVRKRITKKRHPHE
jgi:hypothetical protein